MLLPQSQLNARTLADLLRDMTRAHALQMAQAARKLAKSEAAQRVAQICAELAVA